MVDHLDDAGILDFLYSMEHPRERRKKEAPLDILKMRCASGEMTQE